MGIENPQENNNSNNGSEDLKNKKTILPLPLDSTPAQLDEISAHINNVYQLYNNCFSHFLDLSQVLTKQLSRIPRDSEIINALDDGHKAWFEIWKLLRSNSDWDFVVRFKKMEDWWKEWEPWFKNQYPSYFLEED